MSAEAELQTIAAARRVIADAEARLRDLSNKPMSEEDDLAMRQIQARYDAIYQQLGRSASPPVYGETPLLYRKRLLMPLLKYSETYREVSIADAPPKLLDVCEKQVFTDALAYAKAPDDVPEGELRQVTFTDQSGRKVSEFYGDAKTWMSDFSRPTRAARILKPDHRR